MLQRPRVQHGNDMTAEQFRIALDSALTNLPPPLVARRTGRNPMVDLLGKCHLIRRDVFAYVA